jgi:hypothetical protein
MNLEAVGLWWLAIVVVTIVIAMISVMGMLHPHVIALNEALAIVVALIAVYGWVAEHAGVVRIHPTLVLHVEACCFDAVMEALPRCFAEL